MKGQCFILSGLMTWWSSSLAAEPAGSIDKRTRKPSSYGGAPESLVPYRKSRAPYRDFYETAPVFRGSREGSVDLTTLDSVRIGVFVPLETDGGRQVFNGARMAIDEANAAGGLKGKPFEIVLKNDNLLWGSAANTLVDFVERDHVFAVIGSTDSTSTHVALRAALKVEVPIINVGGADPTLTETGIPWIARLSPDDRQTSYRLAKLLFQELDLTRVAILRSANRDGRFGVREFSDAAKRLGKPVPMELQFVPGKDDFLPQLERLKRGNVEAIALWADLEDGARILRLFRDHDITQPIVTTGRMLSPRLLELAGAAAEGLILTSFFDVNRRDDPWLRFAEEYRRKHEEEPGVLAAFGFDAAALAMEAIKNSGLNRARIQDYLASIRKREGLAGSIVLDETSNCISNLLLIQVRDGQLVRYR